MGEGSKKIRSQECERECTSFLPDHLTLPRQGHFQLRLGKCLCSISHSLISPSADLSNITISFICDCATLPLNLRCSENNCNKMF